MQTTAPPMSSAEMPYDKYGSATRGKGALDSPYKETGIRHVGLSITKQSFVSRIMYYFRKRYCN